MCGIAYCRMLKGGNANRDIKTIYFSQKQRGVDGYGFLSIGDTVKHFRSKYEHLILHDLKCNKNGEILFHHRNPTSTENTDTTAHPLCSNGNFKDHKYYLVHNGMIQNAGALYRRHTDDGLVYSSVCGIDKYDMPIFNDSESLLLELALVIEGKREPKDFNACGSVAFIMIQTDNNDKPLNIYFGRNEGSPLKIKAEKTKFIIASDIDGDDVATDQLNQISYITNEVSKRTMIFPRYYGYSGNRDILKDIHDGRWPDGDNRPLAIETPRSRERMMGKHYSMNDEIDDEDDLSKKEDGELYLLQEGFVTDLDVINMSMQGEHDKDELARLRSEKAAVENALKKVDDEINSRIKQNELIPRV